MELDMAVAKACGLVVVLHDGRILITPREWDESRGIEHTTCEGNVACVLFNPSTDLNAAFAAAEKVSVLLKGVHVEQTLDTWWCSLNGKDHGVFAATPALAICAAILKLKEKDAEARD